MLLRIEVTAQEGDDPQKVHDLMQAIGGMPLSLASWNLGAMAILYAGAEGREGAEIVGPDEKGNGHMEVRL